MGKKSKKNKKAGYFDSAFENVEQIEEAFIEIQKQFGVRMVLSAAGPSDGLLDDIIEEYIIENFGKNAVSYLKMLELKDIISKAVQGALEEEVN